MQNDLSVFWGLRLKFLWAPLWSRFSWSFVFLFSSLHPTVQAEPTSLSPLLLLLLPAASSSSLTSVPNTVNSEALCGAVVASLQAKPSPYKHQFVHGFDRVSAQLLWLTWRDKRAAVTGSVCGLCSLQILIGIFRGHEWRCVLILLWSRCHGRLMWTLGTSYWNSGQTCNSGISGKKFRLGWIIVWLKLESAVLRLFMGSSKLTARLKEKMGVSTLGKNMSGLYLKT